MPKSSVSNLRPCGGFIVVVLATLVVFESCAPARGETAPPIANDLAFWGFVVQFLILFVLILYARDTRKIRQASQEQVESLQKPCLMLKTSLRDFNDAVLEVGGNVGGTILAFHEGNAVLENIGSGLAINVLYEMQPIEAPPDQNVARPNGYLQSIPPNTNLELPIPRGTFQTRSYEFTTTYESLSGRRYQTKIGIDDLVVSSSDFGPERGKPVRSSLIEGRRDWLKKYYAPLVSTAAIIVALAGVYYQKIQLSPPDFDIELENVAIGFAEIRTLDEETTAVYFPFGNSASFYLKVTNLAEMDARKPVIVIETTEAFERVGRPYKVLGPSASMEVQQGGFQYQQDWLFGKQSELFHFNVNIAVGTPDGAAKLKVRVSAKNANKTQQRWFVFNERKTTE